MEKLNVVALFGGQSSEHVVSCMSVQNVAANINKEKYNVILVGITEEGRWLKVDSLDEVKNDTWRTSGSRAVLSPDATEKVLWVIRHGKAEKIPVDVVFPVLHGLYGEDGTVQGILELAQIPYVGCGVLEDAFPYPVFIKPSNAGSSRGVSRADDRKSLENGLKEAALHDRRILVEEMIVGHEVECAVFGGGKEEVRASGVGEILAAADFYDFDAKYYNSDSRTVVDPELPGNAAEEIRESAVRIFKAVDGYGLSRVDFFVKEDGEVVFNEINTMPGFTAISMYPMLWEARGVGKEKLVDDLLEHALRRYER